MAAVNLWGSIEHALQYLAQADTIPRRVEGEGTLLEFVPLKVNRVLDIGSGSGRLIDLLSIDRPGAEYVALDFSSTMLDRLGEKYGAAPNVTIVRHDLDLPLPLIGSFDAVVSSFCIHHLAHDRKRRLYEEVFAVLKPGGVFCNLEHVASATAALHDQFLERVQQTRETEDPSNKLLGLEVQLEWLRDIGFDDVDCHWKWRELALLAGVRP